MKILCLMAILLITGNSFAEVTKNCYNQIVNEMEITRPALTSKEEGALVQMSVAGMGLTLLGAGGLIDPKNHNNVGNMLGAGVALAVGFVLDATVVHIYVAPELDYKNRLLPLFQIGLYDYYAIQHPGTLSYLDHDISEGNYLYDKLVKSLQQKNRSISEDEIAQELTDFYNAETCSAKSIGELENQILKKYK